MRADERAAARCAASRAARPDGYAKRGDERNIKCIDQGRDPVRKKRGDERGGRGRSSLPRASWPT